MSRYSRFAGLTQEQIVEEMRRYSEENKEQIDADEKAAHENMARQQDEIDKKVAKDRLN